MSRFRTPEQIRAFIAANEHRMDRPQQLLGDEPNAYGKPWDDTTLRVCMFACWAYDQAAGNVAIPTVYKAINDHAERFLCDRSYFPATPRDLKTFETADMPIFGIESARPLAEFDVIASSVSYPVLAVNFVKQLAMSGIPVSWQDITVGGTVQQGRWAEPERWPFVMVGGQSYGAPEVLATVVDAWWCGEAEDEGPGNPGIGAVCERIDAYKAIGRWAEDRLGCYADLAREFRFLYFPRWYEIDYAYAERSTVAAVNFDADETLPSKQVAAWVATLPGMRAPVVKRFVHDLDNVPVLDNPPLLYADPGSGVAAALEVQRGCPAWCSFCALTYRQKPYRQRSVETTVAQAKALVANTGSMYTAPFGPDFPMHTQKKRLVKELLEQVTDEVDASSMRVDDFTDDHGYALLQAHAGMDAVTLGVEGNSQRMRDLVGKGCTDDDIKEAVTKAIQAGMSKVKLYMIASLPGEEDADILQILNLARELAEIRDSLGAKTRIQMSWTPLLIEANTPMQWFAPTNPNWLLGEVWTKFKELRIDVKMGAKAAKDRYAFFQGSQRASREAGQAMIEAVAEKDSGCWGGAPRGLRDMMEERLRAHGFHNGFADLFDERDKADMFGWEHIDQAINPEMMWVAYQQMREFLEATSADTYDASLSEAFGGNEWIQRCDERCYGKTCGVCSPADLQHRRAYIGRASGEIDADLGAVTIIDQRTVAARVRLRVEIPVAKRTVGFDHWRYAIRRAANLAEVPIAKRTVRFAGEHTNAYRDLTHGIDYVEFGITRRPRRGEVETWAAAMRTYLAALVIHDAVVLPAEAKQLRDATAGSLFTVEIPDRSRTEVMAAIDRFTRGEDIPMTVRVEKWLTGIQRQDTTVAAHVRDLWAIAEGHRTWLRMVVMGTASPYDVIAGLFGLASWVDFAKTPARREQVLVHADEAVIDAFRPACAECGAATPVDPIDAYHPLCLRCEDDVAGIVVEVAGHGA